MLIDWMTVTFMSMYVWILGCNVIATAIDVMIKYGVTVWRRIWGVSTSRYC